MVREFDPAAAFKTTARSPPAFSLRTKTHFGNWVWHLEKSLGDADLRGDLRKEFEAVSTSAPRWSIQESTKRVPSPLPFPEPAPDAYSLPSSFAGRHPSFPSKGGRGCRFGAVDREVPPCGSSISRSPSPQAYEVSTALRARTPAWSMRGRTPDPRERQIRKSKSQEPSAHSYEPSDASVSPSSPSWAQPRETRASTFKFAEKTPSPDAYIVPGTLGQTHPSFSQTGRGWQFGSAEREAHSRENTRHQTPKVQGPAPTAYEVRRSHRIGNVNQSAAPSWSMRPRTPNLTCSRDLAAGESESQQVSVHSYDPSRSDSTRFRRAPGWSMKPWSTTPSSPTSRRKERQRSPEPISPLSQSRPRSFSPLRSQNSGWSFGSSLRFPDDKPDRRVYAY
eukprot:TRINITY_DN43047_c0_g1_i1.p1 TRINITY_DN43047_c0_g1~~TRINITY_DN43047_c0_g1_i1.p1  ORF type:complete len:402 (-),score=26.61 TRINITY_DN43047_c0_g1_i1:126-1301(-)